MQRTNFTTSINPRLTQALKLQSVKEGRGMNRILEELIAEYLKKQGVDVETDQ